jgi:hypothetical protein
MAERPPLTEHPFVSDGGLSHALRLVLFSGPSGLRKSMLRYALSRDTAWAVIARDGLDRTLEVEEHGPWSPITAYHLMLAIADLNLRNGASTIFGCGIL